MATKSKTAVANPAPVKFPRKSIEFVVERGDSETVQAEKFAELATSPELAACRVISGAENKTAVGDRIDVPTLMGQLRAQGMEACRGDLSRVEAMLMNQATALQSLFSRLAERGMMCSGLTQFEADLRMALRAQAQCRATLETLATVKNPPLIFAKQANIANGPQQINNGMAAPSLAQENEIEQSKLLELQHGNYLDSGATGATISGNQAMAAMGEIDRAEIGRRQSESIA